MYVCMYVCCKIFSHRIVNTISMYSYKHVCVYSIRLRWIRLLRPWPCRAEWSCWRPSHRGSPERTSTQVDLHTYIPTYIHTYIHTYILFIYPFYPEMHLWHDYSYTINPPTSNRTSTPMDLLIIKYTYIHTYIQTL